MHPFEEKVLSRLLTGEVFTFVVNFTDEYKDIGVQATLNDDGDIQSVNWWCGTVNQAVAVSPPLPNEKWPLQIMTTIAADLELLEEE